MPTAGVHVVDYSDEISYYKLYPRRTKRIKAPIDVLSQTCVLTLITNGIDTFYCMKELTEENRFRRFLIRFLDRRKLLLVLNIRPPEKEPLDYKGNELTLQTMWEKVEIENMMSWLSTLGGGFSALGDSFTRCAEMARKISLKQLALGIRLGDPFAQSRCILFYSISLIQTGKLRLAKYIIRSQYKFAVKHAEFDHRLVKMCKGIWLKLQYTYKVRNHRRKRNCDNKLLNC